MIGQFSKPRLGILAAFLVAATLPVMARIRPRSAAKNSGNECIACW